MCVIKTKQMSFLLSVININKNINVFSVKAIIKLSDKHSIKVAIVSFYINDYFYFSIKT